MVFQSSAILNHPPADPGVSFAPAMRLLLCGLICALILCCFNSSPAKSEGFPGKGQPHDWSSALPYYNLGNRYMQKERYEDAIAKYEKAIELYQYDPDFYVNLGVAWRKLENFTAAEAAFKKAAELNAKDWMSWSNLANSYLKQDRLEDTIKAFEQALKCNPPVEEKTAIIKDIADIKKILSVRNGGVQPPEPKGASAKIIPGGKSAANTKAKPAPANATKSRTTNSATVNAPSLMKQTAREAAVPAAPAPKKSSELQDTGWDQVAK